MTRMTREELRDRFSDEDDAPRDCAECGRLESPDARLLYVGGELLCPSCSGMSVCRTCGRPTVAVPPICGTCLAVTEAEADTGVLVEVVSERVRRRVRELAA